MPHFEKFLQVKKSNIPRSRLGLFTKVNIPKGARIVEYKGRLQKWSEVRDQDGYNGYLLKVNTRLAINALPHKKALGRFANDARGLHRKNGLTNNAEYILVGNRCFIDAKKNINCGDEILVNYGWEFWALIKRILKREKK